MRTRALREWLFAAGAVAVGAAGIGFVLSAPFDDSARTALGSGLITGLIVGLAIAAIQWTVERTRVNREEALKEQQHAAMHEIALSRLGALVATHVWTLWNLL